MQEQKLTVSTGQLLKKGYEKAHVLMIGDAPGDQKAAEDNGVLYYPILVKKEKSSWERFLSEGLEKFLSGTYSGKYQEERINEFQKNLSE